MIKNEKPNILWICTDQQRSDTLGCYGNDLVNTPNLDKLASSGVLFERSYSQSPVCTPSRSSFLSGRYPRTTKCRQNGQSIPEDEVLVTKLLAENGYKCGIAGKLHISAVGDNKATERRIDDGFSEFHWSHSTTSHPEYNEYVKWLNQQGMEYRSIPVNGSKYVKTTNLQGEYHQTAWCAQKAIEFIDKQEDQGQPWLFSVNMFDPHHDFDPPKEYLSRYLDKLNDIPLPNYVKGELNNKPIFQAKDHSGVAGQPGYLSYEDMTEMEHQLIRASYWAMIDLIDDQVGRMLEALEKTGQLKNTIVIFMSDHGEMLGDHGIYLKGPYFYEQAVNVPLIISLPGTVQENKRSKALVELVDLAPTLLEACGIDKYEAMQGKSLWSLVVGSSDLDFHRRSAYCEFYNANVHHTDPTANLTMIATEDYKLIVAHGLKMGELYDLNRDPNETENCWNDEEYKDIKMDLLISLADRMAYTVDPLPERKSKW